MNYEPVMGLEVHAQLKTQSKIFCGCSTKFDAKENELTCPVCTGMPGCLPVLNKRAVEFAIKMALATHCNINEKSIFARKNYFYPDLPKGYQISQYDKPLAQKGVVEISIDGQVKKIRLHRIHMEEDAGKNIHGTISSYVNLNRAGIPLIEIVSEPDVRSSQEAGAYLRELRSMLRYLEVCDGNMEEGSFRCDVNVSVRPVGQKEFGTRCEVKNINSFRFVEKAIEYEIQRQIEVLESGAKVIQETRLWDSDQNKTFSMRSKEEAHDYRYFPEPDLLPLMIEQHWVEEIKRTLPELASEKKLRFMKMYQLSEYDASQLVQEKFLAQYFESVVELCKEPKLVSNWILSELLREFGPEQVASCPMTPQHLGELLVLITNGTISGKIAKHVFGKMLETGQAPQAIVEKEGLVQVSDHVQIEALVIEVLKEQKAFVDKYLAGQTKLFGFFVGEVMKKSHGKANPAMVNEFLKKKLKGV
ncbi:MAG: Asp-tRNA(Asn)/Glu-tRNA(Gln) amidotransferase subunit GatB [Deltaproteobacteria bacterium]|nr:Asp-tRNA(Asn)/Glu-tRNA(Gln) amidotransferase subunit GatB [Deltaproteobacteria bacterium]MBI3017813.1 Asp-tRNA(Asn)/Glu-tRNA(Gln) amidotransferase subunit GatB [Deltaproteobacteria bacterium]